MADLRDANSRLRRIKKLIELRLSKSMNVCAIRHIYEIAQGKNPAGEHIVQPSFKNGGRKGRAKGTTLTVTSDFIYKRFGIKV